MKYHLSRHDRCVALRIVGIYALVSCLWIYLSDTVLGMLFRDPTIIVGYSKLKGSLFIAVTGGLLYHLITRHIQETRQTEESLKVLNEELEVRVALRTEELEKSRTELLLQHEKLKDAYRRLEAETAKRIQATEELRLKDRLMIQEARMAAVGEMLGNLAHHWRRPLNRLGLKVQDLLYYQRDSLSKEHHNRKSMRYWQLLRAFPGS
jgi:phosphoglycerate-specific signal transduction histidine kinase